MPTYTDFSGGGGETSVALSPTEAAALFAGARFTIDLFLRDGSGSAIASIQIAQLPPTDSISVGLVDLSGHRSRATVSVSAAATSGFGGGAPEAQSLFGDYVLHCATREWSIQLGGLHDDRYRVVLYAPASPNVATGTLNVNGTILPSLDGDSSCSEKCPGPKSME